MIELLTAIAVAVALEGALYALFPAAMRGMLRQVAALDPSVLRLFGVAGLAVGVLAVWLLRG